MNDPILEQITAILKDYKLRETKLVVGYEIEDGKLVQIVQVTQTFKYKT